MKYVHLTLVYSEFSQLLMDTKGSFSHFLYLGFYLQNNKASPQNSSACLEIIKSLTEEVPVVSLKCSVTGNTTPWPRVCGF